MTKITSINQFQNKLAFEMLGNAEFNVETAAKVSGVNLELNDGDDVVMLKGDDNNVKAGSGDNTIITAGNNNKIASGSGDNNVGVYGTNSSAKTGTGNDNIYVEGKNNSIEAEGGNNTFRIIGDNNSAKSGDGTNDVAILGNENNVELGNGNQYVAYWGDYNNVTMGDGNSKAMTMDFALRDGKFRDLEDKWISMLDYYNSSEQKNFETAYDYTSGNNEIFNALSAEDKDFSETIDMTEKKNGCAKYVIGADADGLARLYVYSYTYNGVAYYYPRGCEGDQSQKAAITNIVQTDVSYYAADSYTMEYSKNYVVGGVSGNNIKFGNGDNTLKHTVADNTNTVDMGQATTGHTVKQELAYTFAQKSSQDFTKYYVNTKNFFTTTTQ